MLRTMITVLVFELGAVLGLEFGFLLMKHKEMRLLRRKRQKLRFMHSIENAGRRLMREDENKRILSEPIRLSKPEPMRKACGLFSSCDAQMLVK